MPAVIFLTVAILALVSVVVLYCVVWSKVLVCETLHCVS